jgi:hypothetical protein
VDRLLILIAPEQQSLFWNAAGGGSINSESTFNIERVLSAGSKSAAYLMIKSIKTYLYDFRAIEVSTFFFILGGSTYLFTEYFLKYTCLKAD